MSIRSAYVCNFVLGERLDANQRISRRTYPDQLIKFRLNGHSVPVLRVLNNEAIKNVMMVVLVLIMSCHVSEKLNSGPLSAHAAMITRAITNVKQDARKLVNCGRNVCESAFHGGLTR